MNLNAAYRQAKATLEGLVAVKPSALTIEAAEALCQVLIIFADILRARGDRNTACDVLDLAFRLESRSNLLPVRAFAYHTAAYVLCDLGHLADAEMFADRAVRICVSAADLNGLGRSLYNRGLMIWRQADCHGSNLQPRLKGYYTARH